MFAGKKTYITAVLGIIGAIAAYLVGDATIAQAGQTVITCLLGAFIRNGVG